MADYSKDFQVAYNEAEDSCTIRFRCFDTPNAVSLYEVSSEGLQVEDILLAIRNKCLALHYQWSFTMPGSDVARMNEVCDYVEVNSTTARLVEAMKRFHEEEPSFDFTIGPVSYLWKRASRMPTEEELAAALEHVGADKVCVEGSTVHKIDPAAQVDVGGAAKGFAADEIAAYLRESGVKRADIDLGGNLYLLGDHPQGRPWRVAVRVPEGFGLDQPIVQLVDASAVTSGSYERFIEVGGKRYQHIVDARTGMPCESDVVSATVISESSLSADLLATTACLVGSAELANLAARHPSCRFLAITAQGEVLDYGKGVEE